MPHPGKPFKVARLSDMEGDEEMPTMKTMRKIKRAHGRDGKVIGLSDTLTCKPL